MATTIKTIRDNPRLQKLGEINCVSGKRRQAKS